jgi:cysteine desulfurase
MGISADIAQSSLRITIGRDTTESDIDITVEDLINATLKLREMSPVWDMIKAGIDINTVFEKQLKIGGK